MNEGEAHANNGLPQETAEGQASGAVSSTDAAQAAQPANDAGSGDGKADAGDGGPVDAGGSDGDSIGVGAGSGGEHRPLTVDELDAKEARFLGVSLEEYRNHKAILAKPIVHAPAINPFTHAQQAIDAAIRADAAVDTSFNASILRAVRGGMLTVHGRPSLHIGPIPGTPFSIIMASRVKSSGVTTVPVVIEHLENGTSREMTDDEVKTLIRIARGAV